MTSDERPTRRPVSGLGDIRFLGDANGILPLDRPHQVKLYGNYTFMGLNLEPASTSAPQAFTPMYANPNYSSAGEIPVPRGTGIQTVTAWSARRSSQLDLQASWSRSLGGKKLTFLADVFSQTTSSGSRTTTRTCS
jgi:hypothetical protein